VIIPEEKKNRSIQNQGGGSGSVLSYARQTPIRLRAFGFCDIMLHTIKPEKEPAYVF
jgi:hypothetical protein